MHVVYVVLLCCDVIEGFTVYHVLLYYHFVPIDDSEAFALQHEALCKELNLRGRILVAPSGLNGTVSGTKASCEAYRAAVHGDERFREMVFKVDEVPDHVFRRLSVRVKPELVTFRTPEDVDPARRTGTHLSPAQFHQMLQRDDVLIVDGRTDYEYDLGHFRGAVRPDISSFREFPAWINQHLSEYRHKPILTYCTGGIRCELLTAYLLEHGYTDVYQLDGGIVTYGKDPEVKGALWDGRCYVFDERISVEINHTEDRRIVGTCYHCGSPTERYINCANVDCHKQHLSCELCEERMDRSCSPACIEAERRDL